MKRGREEGGRKEEVMWRDNERKLLGRRVVPTKMKL